MNCKIMSIEKRIDDSNRHSTVITVLLEGIGHNYKVAFVDTDGAAAKIKVGGEYRMALDFVPTEAQAASDAAQVAQMATASGELRRRLAELEVKRQSRKPKKHRRAA